MLGAHKKHPQAYLLYVEDRFLLSDDADTRLFVKDSLDVWVTDTNGNVYDVEMQSTNKQDLAKRLRYYQSVIDVSSLEKGGHYTDLPDSFILFFCPFDYLNSSLPVYTFKTICSEDTAIILQDGATKVIINSAAADREEERIYVTASI